MDFGHPDDVTNNFCCNPGEAPPEDTALPVTEGEGEAMDTTDQPAAGEQPALKAEEDTPSGMWFQIHFYLFVRALDHSIYKALHIYNKHV